MDEPVIGELEETWDAIDRFASELDGPDWELPTDCPGWAVRDHVAHVVGTERMLLGEEAPPLPEGDYPHVREGIGEVNEAWVAARRDRPVDEVVAEFREVTARRLDALRSMSTEEFDREGWTPIGPGPYRLFMQVRVFDCWTHEQDMRVATGRPGHLEGPIAEFAVRWLVRSLPMVVGKRAAAPEGSSVVVDITGPTPSTVPIVVDGRAGIVEEAPAAPDALVRIDAEAFCRVASGRWAPERVVGEGRVAYEGDSELGRRVLEGLSVVP